ARPPYPRCHAGTLADHAPNARRTLHLAHPASRATVRRVEMKNGDKLSLAPAGISFQKFYCSIASCITGNCNFAFASDFTTSVSAVSEVRFRAVAISLTSKYFARSSIFFSRNDSGLLRLSDTKL